MLLEVYLQKGRQVVTPRAAALQALLPEGTGAR